MSNYSFVDLCIRSNELMDKSELSLVAIAWWYICYCRNNLIFRDESVSHSQATGLIAQFAINWLKSSSEDLSSAVPTPCSSGHLPKCLRVGPKASWSPPPPDVVKLNFDGSKLSDGSAAFGFVIRNSEGQVLLASSQALGSSLSILQAEAWGLREGIRGALALIISRLLTRLRKCGVLLGK